MSLTLDQFCQKYLELSRSGIPIVVVTLTDFRGSVPQNRGARMIIGKDQIFFGTIGGGKLEFAALKHAREILLQQTEITHQSLTWNLQTELGMSCGGEVTLFFELVDPKSNWNITIFGAGHVAQELSRILIRLDCHLTVIDTRSDWIDKLPAATDRFKTEVLTELPAALDRIIKNSHLLLMTMGHQTDFPVLFRALTEFQFPFVGVIGSKAKRIRLEKELREKGYTGPMNFHCPLGEDFGTNAPMEIALSISAQLLKIRDQGRKS